MPLAKRSSKKTRNANIREMISAGKKPKQAIAAGYRIQREALAAKKRKRYRKPTMAKRSRRRRSSSAIVRHSPPSRFRRVGSRVAGVAKSEDGRLMGVALGAAALGYAEREGWSIPSIGGQGEAASLAIAGFVARKFFKFNNKYVNDATTACAAIAIYEYVKGGGGKKVSGDDEPDGGYPIR